jgi:hypothetical protein
MCGHGNDHGRIPVRPPPKCRAGRRGSLSPLRAGGAVRATEVADDASRAAYGGPVGGTMVAAGVRAGDAPPGRESGPTEGVISCGHFAVSGTAVGDHPGGVDQRGLDQGWSGDRRDPLRLLPRLHRYGPVHQPVPQFDSRDHQLDQLLTRRGNARRRTGRVLADGCGSGDSGGMGAVPARAAGSPDGPSPFALGRSWVAGVRAGQVADVRAARVAGACAALPLRLLSAARVERSAAARRNDPPRPPASVPARAPRRRATEAVDRSHSRHNASGPDGRDLPSGPEAYRAGDGNRTRVASLEDAVCGPLSACQDSDLGQRTAVPVVPRGSLLCPLGTGTQRAR